MHLKDVSDSNHTDRNTQTSDIKELMPQGNDMVAIQDEDLEAQIISSLDDEALQEKIKKLLQQVMRDELSKMSVVLREAVRNWVFREKQKYNLTPESPSTETAENLETLETDNKRLEEENQKLKRELELKEHENKIMLSAIKKLTPLTK